MSYLLAEVSTEEADVRIIDSSFGGRPYEVQIHHNHGDIVEAFETIEEAFAFAGIARVA